MCVCGGERDEALHLVRRGAEWDGGGGGERDETLHFGEAMRGVGREMRLCIW